MPEDIVISIVDDDESVREGLTGLMKSHGFAAQAFQHGEDFLQFNRLHGTSCLIADVQMPGMTGLELHDRLVASGKPIPTILITAYPNARRRAQARRAGVICYLAKPFNEDDLLMCIRSALQFRSGS